MESLNKIELKPKELEGLPIFFNRIFHNQVTNIEDELALYKYNEATQSIEMRGYYPNRIICKIYESKTIENGVFKK